MAIIKDPDGFCNIRSEANNQSNIEDTLSNGRLVFSFQEATKGNWLLVDYHKGEQHNTGYIHKSRIVFLKDMTAFKETVVKDTLLKLQLNDMQVTIKAGKFVSTGRRITYGKPGNEAPTLERIDGKRPWGNDWNMPRTEYKFIQFKSGAQTLNFPRSGFNDLFEPVPLAGTSAWLHKTTNTVYLEAWNSDAAGAYVVVWIIKNLQIEHRETFIPF
jgi:hypothetical protein